MRHTDSVGPPWTSNRPAAEASTQQTNIHAPSEIQTRDPSIRVVADPTATGIDEFIIVYINSQGNSSPVVQPTSQFPPQDHIHDRVSVLYLLQTLSRTCMQFHLEADVMSKIQIHFKT